MENDEDTLLLGWRIRKPGTRAKDIHCTQTFNQIRRKGVKGSGWAE